MEFQYNILLENVEQTGRYKNILSTTKKALNAQWQDVLMSGILNDIERIVKQGHTKQSAKGEVKKAIRDEAIIPSGKKALKNSRSLKLIIGSLVSKNLTNLGNLFNYKKEMADFLEFVANKGGQQVMDQISDYTDTRPKSFRLSQEFARQKIRNRVRTLIKTLDKTGKEVLTKELIKGIDKGLTKKQIINNLLKKGVTTSEFRARRIVETETNAVYEYMRFETAKLNGIEFKVWMTAGDDRVCILGFSTKIKTIKGWKSIGEIKKGEYVLTHKDRYKKVLATSKRPYNKEIIKVKFPFENLQLTTTLEHPYYTKRGWVEAKDLKEKDEVYILAKKCDISECTNETIFSNRFCSRSCQAKNSNKILWDDPQQHKRVVKENKKYKKGKKLKIFGDKAIKENKENWIKNLSDSMKTKFTFDKKYRNKIIESNRKRAKEPNFGFKGLSKKELSNLTKKALIARGKNHLSMSGLERKIKWVLDKIDIEYVQQFEIRTKKTTRWVDFYLPKFNLIIEADGELFHKKEKDDIRDKEIRDVMNNAFILHIPEKIIKNNLASCFDIIKANVGMGCFTLVKIGSIERKKLKKSQAVYNIEVEDDESYVAKGIVVHNCPICRPNGDEEELPIRESYPSGHARPPAHVICRCSLIYIINDDVLGVSGLRGTKKSEININDRLDRVLKASADPNAFYKPLPTKGENKIVNPNALWVGKDDLVGKDKEVGVFAQKLEWNDKAKGFLSSLDELSVKFRDDYIPVYGEEILNTTVKASEVARRKLDSNQLLMIEIRLNLTDIGFLQLLRSKGFKGKVAVLEGRDFPNYPVKPLNEIARRHAQDVVRGMENQKGIIDLEKYNIGFIDNNYKEEDLELVESNKNLKVRLVIHSKQFLRGRRIINIMDNINESQKRGGNGILVVIDPEENKDIPEKSYIIFGDGDHRLFASKQLGLVKIKAAKIWRVKSDKNT